jgi:hypothetical protein
MTDFVGRSVVLSARACQPVQKAQSFRGCFSSCSKEVMSHSNHMASVMGIIEGDLGRRSRFVSGRLDVSYLYGLHASELHDSTRQRDEQCKQSKECGACREVVAPTEARELHNDRVVYHAHKTQRTVSKQATNQIDGFAPRSRTELLQDRQAHCHENERKDVLHELKLILKLRVQYHYCGTAFHGELQADHEALYAI